MQDASRRSWGNFVRIAKFLLCIEISLYSEISLHREFSIYSEILAMLAKFRYIAKLSPLAKLPASCFCAQTTPFLVFSISTLTIIILFRIDWYFHLFLRLYKPSYEQFVI